MQFGRLKRREFISLLGGTAAWPLAVRAQSMVPVIGVLSAAPAVVAEKRMISFYSGLGESGLVPSREWLELKVA